MSAAEIDAYLAELDDQKRATLQIVRERVLAVIPPAEQGMAYGAPAFRVGGRLVAGFAAFSTHLSYFPHSGQVTAELMDRLEKYDVTKGSVKFPIDKPLPAGLIKALVRARLAEIATG